MTTIYTVSLLLHKRGFTLDVRAFIGVEAELGSLKAVQVQMFYLLSNIDQKCRQSETTAVSHSYSADSVLHHPAVGRQAHYQGGTAFRQLIFQPDRCSGPFRPIYTTIRCIEVVLRIRTLTLMPYSEHQCFSLQCHIHNTT